LRSDALDGADDRTLERRAEVVETISSAIVALLRADREPPRKLINHPQSGGFGA